MVCLEEEEYRTAFYYFSSYCNSLIVSWRKILYYPIKPGISDEIIRQEVTEEYTGSYSSRKVIAQLNYIKDKNE